MAHAVTAAFPLFEHEHPSTPLIDIYNDFRGSLRAASLAHRWAGKLCHIQVQGWRRLAHLSWVSWHAASMCTHMYTYIYMCIHAKMFTYVSINVYMAASQLKW